MAEAIVASFGIVTPEKRKNAQYGFPAPLPKIILVSEASNHDPELYPNPSSPLACIFKLNSEGEPLPVSVVLVLDDVLMVLAVLLVVLTVLIVLLDEDVLAVLLEVVVVLNEV